ncbi:azaleucine resistance protein AzlC [Levilactobacillus brevis]|uniref:Branched-chain amino acid ABC transporter permease n=1 Tax=Levilactobacillus brevis TaxID=1580 RepID=A0A1W6NI15_LEVBR|nr:AzlC family ABC transporter permease [Levilactobacillus brevis]ANN49623.1 azaleucine resistance protein AzlC [Levilactobacillus brevis]ARN93120.1 branched-chain amino acid transporter AzlC [Levilactobacillus brevis]ARN95749.1 branched-chain amino acid transporter AzlC [Levilactobacillus brevis]ATU71145.1 branched-chain amino acid ABC transporter permease [Levilactobacillus brevis]KIP00372.1 amino acid transport protein [Levilactobacillus brevis]
MGPDLTFRAGIRDVLPTVFGYIGVGLAFGIVAHTSHLSLLMVAGLSFIVYAGSAQFIITSMLLIHDPLSAIFISTFLVNSRMILMSTSLAQYFRHESLIRNVLIGTLVTDETFALAMNKQNKTHGQLSFAWQSAANLVAYLVWGLATLVGAILGGLIANPSRFGFDFALTAMFIGLVYLQLISDKHLGIRLQLFVMGFVALIYYLMIGLMSANFALLVATVAGCLFGMEMKKCQSA